MQKWNQEQYLTSHCHWGKKLSWVTFLTLRARSRSLRFPRCWWPAHWCSLRCSRNIIFAVDRYLAQVFPDSILNELLEASYAHRSKESSQERFRSRTLVAPRGCWCTLITYMSLTVFDTTGYKVVFPERQQSRFPLVVCFCLFVSFCFALFRFVLFSFWAQRQLLPNINRSTLS